MNVFGFLDHHAVCEGFPVRKGFVKVNGADCDYKAISHVFFNVGTLALLK
jgi:hypothetical protein